MQKTNQNQNSDREDEKAAGQAGATPRQSSLAELLAKTGEKKCDGKTGRGAFLEFASRQSGATAPTTAQQPVPVVGSLRDRVAAVTSRAGLGAAPSFAPSSVKAPSAVATTKIAGPALDSGRWVLDDPEPARPSAEILPAEISSEMNPAAQRQEIPKPPVQTNLEPAIELVEVVERKEEVPAAQSAVSPAQSAVSPAQSAVHLDELEFEDDFDLNEIELTHGDFEQPATSALEKNKSSGEAVLYSFQAIDSQAHEKELKKSLDGLADLIANVVEAYSASIFIAYGKERILEMYGAHTLSREFVRSVKIPFGSGLVGWAAEHARRISVCPFENDATTLLYYSKDQALKSFIAVPIVDSRGRLLGVIACDSKKSYAFSKMNEKILVDCAKAATKIIELHQRLGTAEGKRELPTGALDDVLSALRLQDDERTLLSTACDLPEELVRRDALVVLALAEGGIGEGVFYTKASESRIGNRLLEHVCRHKRIICGDRSVHTTPTDDIKNRSFLSIPFRVLGKEAGSLNLLSRPNDAFQASEINALEHVAQVVGRELERVRLRAGKEGSSEILGLQSWKNFELHGKVRIAEAKKQRQALSLVRLRFTNLPELENVHGIEATVSLVHHLFRVLEQVKGHDALACPLYGTDVLLLVRTEEEERVVKRFRALVEQGGLKSNGQRAQIIQTTRPSGIGPLLAQGLTSQSVRFPRDGETIADLAGKTLREANVQQSEVAVNAWNWR